MAHTVQFAEAPTGSDFASASDTQLFNTQIFLQLGCQRTKLSSRTKQRAYFCYLARVVLAELNARGISPPTTPSKVTDLRKA